MRATAPRKLGASVASRAASRLDPRYRFCVMTVSSRLSLSGAAAEAGPADNAAQGRARASAAVREIRTPWPSFTNTLVPPHAVPLTTTDEQYVASRPAVVGVQPNRRRLTSA